MVEVDPVFLTLAKARCQYLSPSCHPPSRICRPTAFLRGRMMIGTRVYLRGGTLWRLIGRLIGRRLSWRCTSSLCGNGREIKASCVHLKLAPRANEGIVIVQMEQQHVCWRLDCILQLLPVVAACSISPLN